MCPTLSLSFDSNLSLQSSSVTVREQKHSRTVPHTAGLLYSSQWLALWYGVWFEDWSPYTDSRNVVVLLEFVVEFVFSMKNGKMKNSLDMSPLCCIQCICHWVLVGMLMEDWISQGAIIENLPNEFHIDSRFLLNWPPSHSTLNPHTWPAVSVNEMSCAPCSHVATR